MLNYKNIFRKKRLKIREVTRLGFWNVFKTSITAPIDHIKNLKFPRDCLKLKGYYHLVITFIRKCLSWVIKIITSRITIEIIRMSRTVWTIYDNNRQGIRLGFWNISTISTTTRISHANNIMFAKYCQK